MEVAGFVVGILGLMFGGYQLRQAHRSSEHMETMGAHISEMRHVILRPARSEAHERPTHLAGVTYADVNHDGEDELLIQHPYGVHGMMLRVFGWDGLQFGELANLSVGTPEGFTVADIDGDGRVEVATVETDWDRVGPKGQTYSYVDGARKEQLYRWEGHDWTLVDERKLALPGKGGKSFAKRQWNTEPIIAPPTG